MQLLCTQKNPRQEVSLRVPGVRPEVPHLVLLQTTRVEDLLPRETGGPLSLPLLLGAGQVYCRAELSPAPHSGHSLQAVQEVQSLPLGFPG